MLSEELIGDKNESSYKNTKELLKIHHENEIRTFHNENCNGIRPGDIKLVVMALVTPPGEIKLVL